MADEMEAVAAEMEGTAASIVDMGAIMADTAGQVDELVSQLVTTFHVDAQASARANRSTDLLAMLSQTNRMLRQDALTRTASLTRS